MTCKNCGHSIDGNYCSQCGQKSDVDRIHLAYFTTEVWGSFFQINHGFFYTLKELFVAPGKSITEFLSGKRKIYASPISYVLTLSTLYFLIALCTNQNTWMDDFISGAMNGAREEDDIAEVPAILIWFSKNYAYATLLLLPVFSLASYLSFSKSGNNYLEHLVINSYITGQQAIFYSFFVMVGGVAKHRVLEILPAFLATAYTFWVYWQFFKEGNRIVNILRSIATYLMYLIFSLGLLILLMAIFS